MLVDYWAGKLDDELMVISFCTTTAHTNWSPVLFLLLLISWLMNPRPERRSLRHHHFQRRRLPHCRQKVPLSAQPWWTVCQVLIKKQLKDNQSDENNYDATTTLQIGAYLNISCYICAQFYKTVLVFFAERVQFEPATDWLEFPSELKSWLFWMNMLCNLKILKPQKLHCDKLFSCVGKCMFYVYTGWRCCWYFVRLY